MFSRIVERLSAKTSIMQGDEEEEKVSVQLKADGASIWAAVFQLFRRKADQLSESPIRLSISTQHVHRICTIVSCHWAGRC
jgi:hypothetical protein